MSLIDIFVTIKKSLSLLIDAKLVIADISGLSLLIKSLFHAIVHASINLNTANI